MAGKEDNRIFVGGLSFDITERQLESAFGRFGKIVECQVLLSLSKLQFRPSHRNFDLFVQLFWLIVTRASPFFRVCTLVCYILDEIRTNPETRPTKTWELSIFFFFRAYIWKFMYLSASIG